MSICRAMATWKSLQLGHFYSLSSAFLISIVSGNKYLKDTLSFQGRSFFE